MKIGAITCNYFTRIYGYTMPADFKWDRMVEKYRREFDRAQFVGLAGEIAAMGYENLEIWEPHFSYLVYSEDDASAMAAELKGMGLHIPAYCIGGWREKDIPNIERCYRFAKALGADVVDGTLPLEGAEGILQELERCGRRYGFHYAVENHAYPSIERPEDVARLIEGYSTVGANIDTGIYNAMGHDVLAAARLLKGKIYHLHLKDTRKGDETCLPIGDGDVQTAELLKLLQQWNYPYMASVEFEHEAGPAAGMAQSLAYVKRLLD